MNIDEFDFTLPQELIAQYPPQKRGSSKLLIHQNSSIINSQFDQIMHYFKKDDVLVINNTKVIKARLKGKKKSGGRIEVLVERVINIHEAYCLIKASNSPHIGQQLNFDNDITANVINRYDNLFHLRFDPQNTLWDILEDIGDLPLPPYIARKANLEDENRYQTVFAKNIGAVAAPTAGLHFTEHILKKLKDQGVKIVEITLHVGAGTFQPVRVQDINKHHMHSEWFSIPKESQTILNEAIDNQQSICAVGTTSLRALESSGQSGKIEILQGDTDIFIKPGYQFKIVDRLFTNFHLPKSTLLILVSAFSGLNEIRTIYQHAISHQYRFFSYGDCMLLARKK
ncbi:MAG: tRNA preQ1(34) S-adenosylmethionine ribosyltransferase-isomerase QueA [Neisseriaceae bacterium]|nr:MAG: tRNA preQ1(34) S-adenosylmethionine ribosyltransferase-isomerase QueA [Neisseriaceae bacterium]